MYVGVIFCRAELHGREGKGRKHYWVLKGGMLCSVLGE